MERADGSEQIKKSLGLEEEIEFEKRRRHPQSEVMFCFHFGTGKRITFTSWGPNSKTGRMVQLRHISCIAYILGYNCWGWRWGMK
ncbi:hypothetical protein LguiA_024895 [Lonicera macranthoides]